MLLSEICDLEGVTNVTGDPAGLFAFGVTENSRDVRFSDVFCARPSFSEEKSGGEVYCKDAIAQGAQAIVVSDSVLDTDLGLNDYQLAKVVVIRVSNVPEFFAKVVRFFYPQVPSILAAITGTNGKTSTASFVKDIWNNSGSKAAALGTLGVMSFDGLHTNLEKVLTTYDAMSLHRVLQSLINEHEVERVVLEASSHALHQERLSGLEFDLAAFTNLTRDHLDYHGSMTSYGEAKLRLFQERLLHGGISVVNKSDTFASSVIAAAAAKDSSIITYSHDIDAADLSLVDVQNVPTGLQIAINAFGSKFEIQVPVAGLFQVENILCALGIACGSGTPVDAAVQAASSVSPVRGRMELVASLHNGAAIYVDYAHTDDALDNVLRSLRPHIADGRNLSVVFGCGGVKDAGKRQKMGSVAARYANKIYVTDDNPRSESPAKIRSEILTGAGPSAIDVSGRFEAIDMAINDLKAGDVLIVAGKGHEDYQIVLDQDAGQSGRAETTTKKLPFDDAAIIRQLVY